MYYIEKHGLANHWKRIGVDDAMREESWLSGMLRYAGSIEPQLVSQWQHTFDEALSNRDPYEPLPNHDED
jgi:hypothetical protein